MNGMISRWLLCTISSLKMHLTRWTNAYIEVLEYLGSRSYVTMYIQNSSCCFQSRLFDLLRIVALERLIS